MGLFSNNKKPCPICGNATPRLMASKVEGTPICNACAVRVDLPAGVFEQMSLDEFRNYLSCCDENQPLRDMFTETYKYKCGFLQGKILLDETNRLFRLRDNPNAFVMEASRLKGFRILEDDNVLFENGDNSLRCYHSDVPEKVKGMAEVFLQYAMKMQEYERWESMEQERRERMERNGQTPPASQVIRPDIEIPTPFSYFHIDVQLEHPYWSEFRWDVNGPKFDNDRPSVDAYLHEYEEAVEKLHVLAFNLMQFMSPGAGEVEIGTETEELKKSVQQIMSQAAPQVDAVEEIKKYKQLLDEGIITEAEFEAKKRQLMGI